ncbi:MAG: hypothetical protein AB2A00_42555 [Myxococcota bacterium]
MIVGLRGAALGALLLLVAWDARGQAPAAAPVVERAMAVLPLEAKTGVNPDAAEFLTETVVVELRRTGLWQRVVTPRDMISMLSTLEQKQLVRCAQDECTLVDVEIAGALGVSHMLVGTVGKLGGTYLLALKVLDLKTGLAAASVTQRVRGETEEALADAVPVVVAELMRGMGLLVPEAPSESRPRWPLAAVGAGVGSLVGGVGLALVGLLPLLLGVAGSAWAYSTPEAFAPLVAGVPSRNERVLLRVFGPAATGGLVGGAVLLVALVLTALGVAGLGAGAGALLR